MNKLICGILLLITFGAYSQTPNVSYEYDEDGNMKIRKIIVTGPLNTKKNQTEETVLEDKLGEKKIVIYPNPTRGVFQISVTGLCTDEINLFSLYSLNGTLLLKRSIVNDMTRIDISGFPEGAYLLDINLGDKISRWKIIKK